MGISFIFIFKDPEWKRNGFLLAFAASLGSILTAFFGALSIIVSAIIILIYIIFLLFKFILIKLWRNKFSGFYKIVYQWGNLSYKIKLTIKVTMALIPILMWSFFNIRLGVMFNNNPHLLWIHGPSMTDKNQKFDLVVQCWDQFERLSANYKGTVEFSIKSYNLTSLDPISSPIATLPHEYTFTGKFLSQGIMPAYYFQDGKDNGMHIFKVCINTTGIHYILVNDTFTGNTYWSNPIIVRNLTGKPILVWGDIHTHSALSDGSGTPDKLYDFARNIASLEFYSLTDHGEDLNNYGFGQIGFNLYSIAESEANKAYDPGNFVTFPGVEWTTNYLSTSDINFGHYTIIFSGDQLAHIDSNIQNNPEKLWKILAEFTNSTGSRALALPHHCVRKSFIQDWGYANSTFVRIAEASSVHGESLFAPQDDLNHMGSIDVPDEYVHGASIIDALNMGLRLTLYGSSDCHDGHPGHSISHTQANIGHQAPYCIDYARTDHHYPGALTAAFVDDLTRNDVFNALENGQIYANSDFGRPILNFTINSIPVEYNVTVSVPTNTSPRVIRVFVAQDGTPAAKRETAASVHPNWQPNWNATIEIIKNGELYYNESISEPIFLLNITDNSLITGASYDNCIIGDDGKSYINQYSDKPVDNSTLNTNGIDYYIARLVSENGRTTYAGPIWVKS
ncbi:MAG: DUF3604 domain-containing protein [Candidatus Lokiarchaeota archaeon]|nr:DUF3604 domain-containing protein [Candidatus Lokiarchaeota archaeon]